MRLLNSYLSNIIVLQTNKSANKFLIYLVELHIYLFVIKYFYIRFCDGGMIFFRGAGIMPADIIAGMDGGFAGIVAGNRKVTHISKTECIIIFVSEPGIHRRSYQLRSKPLIQ